MNLTENSCKDGIYTPNIQIINLLLNPLNIPFNNRVWSTGTLCNILVTFLYI